nr:MAG TPA: hypothetical protein [Crassvirales sp.]
MFFSCAIIKRLYKQGKGTPYRDPLFTCEILPVYVRHLM